MRDLDDFIRQNYPKHTLENADTPHLSAYFSYLHQQSYAATTAARKLSACRQFYQFLLSEQQRDDDPSADLDAPKMGRSIPHYLSENDISHLMQVAEADMSPEGIRLYALLTILYASGLRVSEAIALTTNSIQKIITDDGKTHYVAMVKGKGNKERLAPLNHEAIDAVDCYLPHRASFLPKGKTSRFLFPTRAKQGYLTRQRLGQLLKALALTANMDPARLSPHILRHSFASHLLAGGMDLRVLQTLLGHSDITTTQIYTHITQDKLVSVVEQLHPLGRL